MSQLTKRPIGRNKNSGNVTLTDAEWDALNSGVYQTILVIRDKHTTKLYYVEDWMIRYARDIQTDEGHAWLVPVSKGSPIYRYARY